MWENCEKYRVNVGTGLNWLKIGPSGEILCLQWWALGIFLTDRITRPFFGCTMNLEFWCRVTGGMWHRVEWKGNWLPTIWRSLNEKDLLKRRWWLFTCTALTDHFPVQCSPMYGRALLFGKFPGFARLSFWEEEHVDEDEYRAVVEWYWQGKTELLGEKPVPVSLSPPQISHGLAWDRTLASAVRGRWLTAWATAQSVSFL